MTKKLIESLQRRRDGYPTEVEFHRFLLDAFTGSGGFRGKVKQAAVGYFGWAATVYSAAAGVLNDEQQNSFETYLDRYPREDDDKFSRRKDVAHYTNYMRPLTELKVSYLGRREPAIHNLPDDLVEWSKDVTGGGVPMSKFRRDMNLRAAALGWIPIVADAPERPQGDSVSAAEFDGTPFLRPLLPCNLADYAVSEDGVFLWAKIVQTETVHNEWQSEPVKRDRYTIWTPDAFEVYTITDDDKVDVIASGPHQFGQVPLIIWRTTRDVEDQVLSEALHSDVAVESRRLFNLHSEFDEHMRSQVFALLVLATKGDVKDAVVGTDNAIRLDPSASKEHYYLSPEASVAATYENRIERTVQELYRMARVEYTRPSGTQSSGQSRREEFEQTNLAISDMALATAEAEEEIYRIVGHAMGISDDELAGIEVEAAQNFDSQKISEEIDEVLQALEVPAGTVFRSELIKRFVRQLMPDATPQILNAIEAEIDALAEEAAQEAASLTDAGGDEEGDEDEGGDGGGGDEGEGS